MKIANLLGTAVLALATISLAACADSDHGDGADSDVDEGTGDRTVLEATTNDRIISAKDFDNEQLGGRIEGPVGTEVNASFLFDGQSYGDIESYVACPINISNCDPKNLPAGTIYTYVHVVTPGIDENNDEPFMPMNEVATVASANTFNMRLPSTGFSGEAGYSLNQARAASGPRTSFSIKCEEDMLVFEKASGEEWTTGETITFFWKSTVPPQGPGKGFILGADGKLAVGTGPVPGAPPSGEVKGCA